MEVTRMKLYAFLICLMSPVMLLAQDVEPPAEEPMQLAKYIALLITGVLVPLAVEMLKKLSPKIPQFVKVLLSLSAGALIGMATTALSNWLGIPVDLSALEAALAGLTVGGAAAMGYGVKKFKTG